MWREYQPPQEDIMQKTCTLSFKDLKQRVSIEQVLRHYDLFESLELRGKSHRGPCPFCEAEEGVPFSVSLEKNCYQCFACKASGNILDFVVQREGVKIREAGQFLAQHFLNGKAPHASATPVHAVQPEAPPDVERKEKPNTGLHGLHQERVRKRRLRINNRILLPQTYRSPLPSKTLIPITQG
jgi:hypothetical protein